MTRLKKTGRLSTDTTPDVPAAGMAVHIDHGSAKSCLDWNHSAPYQKRSLLDPIQHMPGKVAPNVTAVSDKARKLTHGVRGEYKYTAGDVLFPPRPHPLLMEREARRERIYHRREHQVLGAALPNATKLPEFTKDPEFLFGMSTKEDDDVRVVIHPKPRPEDDDEKYHRQYILSHKSYKPGEKRSHYGADWTTPKEVDSSMKSRSDNDGKRVHDSLYWETQRQDELKSKIISKRLSDFRERRQPELGQVHDPMKDTMAHLSPDHTFGIKYTPDEYSVGHLIGSGKKVSKSDAKKRYVPTMPAGIPTRHERNENRQHVAKLREEEDATLGLKITEDIPGGQLNITKLKGFDLNHVFGVPSVRGHRMPVAKRLADNANYGDELGTKALIYPTPLNVYGHEQLESLEKELQKMGVLST